MSKIGRNDPCPCSSGKKYKKCCQEEDEKKAGVARNSEQPGLLHAEAWKIPPAVAGKEKPPIVRDEKSPSLSPPEPSEVEALDEKFRSADFAEMVRMLESACSALTVDDETLQEWLLDVSDAVKTEQEGIVFGECVDLFRESKPEAFEERAVSLLKSKVEIAVRFRRNETIRQQYCKFSSFAYQDIDQVFRLADRLAYHGLLDALVEGFRVGWPSVRDAKGIFTSGIEIYADLGAYFEIFDYLGHFSHPDLKDRELANRVRFYYDSEDHELEKSMGEVLGLADDAWARDDFGITRKAYRKEDGKSLRFNQILGGPAEYLSRLAAPGKGNVIYQSKVGPDGTARLRARTPGWNPETR